MNKNKITLMLVGVLVVACGVAGRVSLKNIAIDKFVPSVSPVSCISMGEREAGKIQDKYPVHLYYATKENKLKLVVRYIPMSDAKKNIGELATIIMEELIRTPKEKDLHTVVPKGTTLRNPVKVEDSVATIDLSKEFLDNHKGGLEQETLTIFAIVNSVTELKDIQSVRFRVNGKTLKEYKGNFRFDKDFPRYKVKNIMISPTNVAKNTTSINTWT